MRGKSSFGGFGGFGGANLQQLMRQAQKLQEDMKRVGDEVEAKTFEGSAGGGVVTCKISGKREVLEVKIKPEVIDPDDVDMLQDMIVVAVNDALRVCNETRSQMMDAVTPSDLGDMGGLF